MDVVRITQALRQQQLPGRLSSSRGGNNTLSTSDCSSSTAPLISNEPVSIRRGTWDSGLNINTAELGHENSRRVEQDNRAAPTSATPTSASPSSSFFSFSLASLLPSASTETSGFFTGGASAASAAAPSNMGEIESLLLRSMPMFGNLVSRD
ncbi:hypothetical protein BGZ58_011253 [Dissophora ornata]|nr:hypothetical protein BGZ58_011253 [Dissophora ornata]